MSALWPHCLRSTCGSGGLTGQRIITWWSGVAMQRGSTATARSMQRRRLHHCASALCSYRRHRHTRCPSASACAPAASLSHRRLASSTTSSPSSSPSPPPSLSSREEEVMAALQRIPHPSDSSSDIAYSGSVVGLREKNGDVEVTLLLDAHYRDISQRVRTQLTQQLPWIRSVRVSMDAASPSASAPSSSSPAVAAAGRPASNLSAVHHIIAVSSCKGGVGKSVVAVNLAYSLSCRGLRVGLLDADLFGPSLPTMIAGGGLAGSGLHYGSDGSSIQPYDYRGVKTMSYGYAAPASSPSSPSSPSSAPPPSPHAANILRGPIASTLIRDLLTRTAWSSLDYLIIDCPPGTSDILLTLTQTARISAAVVVTTPQRLAYVDVMKGLHMLAAVQVEVAALVENMSWTRCGGCGQQRKLFGKGHMDEMRAELQRMRQERRQRAGGAAAAAEEEEPAVLEYRLPIAEEISEWSDRGEPFVLTTGGGEEAAAARAVYGRMAQELHARMQLRGAATAGAGQRVRWEPDREQETAGAAGGGLLVMEGSGSAPAWVDAFVLRSQCRCAACVDERTGQRTARGRARAGVRVLGMQPKGNYAVAVHWSDGHASSIYTYQQIAELGSASREEARQAGAAALQLHQQQQAAAAAG